MTFQVSYYSPFRESLSIVNVLNVGQNLILIKELINSEF